MGRAANPSIGDRRSAQRAATRRKAVVICADAATPLFTGTAVDISRDGVAIHANATLSVGTAVDLEIEPRKDVGTGALIRVSGHIVRCESAGPHEFAMGIHFRVLPPLRNASILQPVYREVVLRPTPPPARNNRESRTRLAPWLAILTVILLFLLWWPFGDSGVSADHGRGSARARELASAVSEPDLAPSQKGDLGFQGEVNGQEVDRAIAETDFSDVGGPARPVDTLDDLYGMGGPGDFVSFANELEGGYPGPPATSAVTHRPELLGASGKGSGSRPPSTRIQLASGVAADRLRAVSSGNRSHQGVEADSAPSRVHLDVNRDTYEMNVFVDGALVWRFPVGLGRDGSTPSGHFAIHNKISRPDWYHRGDSVPYGDPRNPLGESWMGLAADGAPLSYGIHPTTEPDSIGGSKGAGCIRMRPEDAETLFRLCPIGATVRIGTAR